MTKLSTPAVRAWRAALAVASFMALAACATPNAGGMAASGAQSGDASGSAAAPAQEGAAVKINFIDVDSFDKSMESALANGAKEIEVVLVAPMSPNAISPRLGRWINTVQETGGEVKVDSDARTRSASLLISLLDAAIGAWKDVRTKALVKDVQAEMVVRANHLESVKFTRRP